MKKTYILLCLLMVLGISVKTMATATDPGTVNLKHQWKFDNGVTDNVGTVNGTLMGGATVSNGDLNTINGGYVKLDSTMLAISTYTELTVEAWFTPSAGASAGQYRFLYYFGNTDAGGIGNHCTGYTPTRGENVGMSLINAGGNQSGVNSTQFDDGLLHHMVCVIDASTLTSYIDGNLISSVSIGANSLASVGNQFAYFAKGGWPDPTWNGLIHEISIYNKALTADNVKFLYDQNKIVVQSTNPGTANLKHQWTFDDGTTNDAVGGVNGVLSGVDATIANKALNLTGGYVTLDAVALAVNTYPALTVEAWFTPLAGANNGFRFLYYLGNSDGGGNHFTGFTPTRGGNNGPLSKFLIATGNYEDGEVSVMSYTYDDSRLHHMVCVVDAINITAYMDGNLLAVTPLGANSLANVTANGKGNPFAYFGKGGWPDPTWQGQIQEISMYNTALSAENVKYLYNGGNELPTGSISSVSKTEKMIQSVYASNNQIVAQFESTSTAPSKIEIYNLQGALLSSEAFTCNAGLNNKTVKANYAAGIYLVRLSVAGQTSYTKIVK